MNLSNPILNPFILCNILWQWISHIYIYISCVEKCFLLLVLHLWPISAGSVPVPVYEKEWVVILDHFLRIIFYFTDFCGMSSALSFTGCMILTLPCTVIVPWCAALKDLKKVMSNQTKSRDDSRMYLPGLLSLIPPCTTQAFPNVEKTSVILLSCFLNAVTLHHAQHPLAAKFLTSFASPLKGHLLCLVLNLHLLAWLVPQPLVLKKSLEGKFQFIFSGL